jgi:hypothetical protein
VRTSKLARGERCSISRIPLQRIKNALLPTEVKITIVLLMLLLKKETFQTADNLMQKYGKRNISQCVKKPFMHSLRGNKMSQ